MPGLLRGMATTAVLVGTATATRNAVNRRQANKNAQAYTQAMNSAYAQPAPPPQQYAPPPQQYTPPPADPYYASQEALPVQQDDMIAQLERLGALKAQGLLTDEEFAAAKQKLLMA